MTSEIDYDLFYEQRGALISVSEDISDFNDKESLYEYFYHNGMERITFNKSTGRSTVLEYYLYS